jgi:hypothetical protein
LGIFGQTLGTKQDAGSRLIASSFLTAGGGEELVHCFIPLLLFEFEFAALLFFTFPLPIYLTYHLHYYLPITYPYP